MANQFYGKVLKENGREIVEMGYADAIKASIAPKEGNNLFSLCCEGNDIIWYDENLPLADFLTGSPILFPFPNRIENCMWEWKGEKHLQKKNGAPILMHSLVYDESWEYEESIVQDDCVILNTSLEVDANHPIYRGYPFCFTLQVVFTLKKDGLAFSYSVTNNSDEEMPFGFALHPYLRKIGKTSICVPAKYVYDIRTDMEKTFLNKINDKYLLIPNLLPSGEISEVKGTRYDLNTYKDINSLELDDVYTELAKPAMINYEDIRLNVSINSSEDFTHSVVFTPPDKSDPLFAIEPQTCSTDAINLSAKGIEHAHLMTLESGEKHTGNIEIAMETY